MALTTDKRDRLKLLEWKVKKLGSRRYTSIDPTTHGSTPVRLLPYFSRKPW